MSSECKSHKHSKGGMPKFPKNVFYFTFLHLSTSVISTYYVSLYFSYTIPLDYPEYHFEFHFTLYFICWFLCMVNLVLARFKSSGKSISTENPEDEKCDRCKINRTERSHHCSTCRQCVTRMDHHCTWVSNCIGLNNHKNFFWYTFFTAVGGTYHMYLVFCYTFSDYPPAYSGFLSKILYFYHSFIVLFFSYFCYTLLNIQCRLIWNGNTNMEYMKEMGMNMSFLYCKIFNIETEYDSGAISNLFQVFGSDFFFWMVPTSADNWKYCDGCPKTPKPSIQVVQEFKVKYDLD